MAKIGRPVGSKNIRTVEIELLAKELDCNPFEVMIHMAKGDFKSLGYEDNFIISTGKDGQELIKERLTIDHRLTAAKELAQYLAPKRKAIEHSRVDARDEPKEKLAKHREHLRQVLQSVS